tara:strand:+ start:528 stop:1433 length:906 start_codon:yes stop_codon:yes gene_type:complete
MKDIMSFLELVTDESEPPEPIIDNGILLSESLLTIIGAPKVGKSFLVFNLATAMINGNDFGGFKINGKHKVMFLSAEGGYYPNRKRLRRITKGIDKHTLSNAYFSHNPMIYLDNDEHHGEMIEMLFDLEIDVLIIDPLIRFHRQDENSSTAMSEVMTNIRRLIYYAGVSIILVHHTGKQVNRGGRGSSVISGEYDSAIYMHKKWDSIELSFDTRHVETPQNVNLRFNPDTFWFEETTAAVTPRENPVITYLEKKGPIKQKELVKQMENSGIGSSTSIYRWLQCAKKEDKIKEKQKMLELME